MPETDANPNPNAVATPANPGTPPAPPAAAPTLTPTTPNPPEPAAAAPAEGSLLNQEEKPAGAPETYADFTAPEGQAIDKEALAQIAPVFKELNLTQEQAQKLVDVQLTREKALQSAPRAAYEALRTGWQNEVKTEYGSRLPEVRTDIARALGQIDPKIAAGFREAMDTTGAGDNPAFVRAFHALSKLVNEGRPVTAGGPSPVATPNGRPTSHAAAIYGNLPA